MVYPGYTRIILRETDNNPCIDELEINWGEGLAISSGSNGTIPDNGGVIAEIRCNPTLYYDEERFNKDTWKEVQLKWAGDYKIGESITYEYFIDPNDKKKGVKIGFALVEYVVPDFYRDAINQGEGCE